MKWLCSRNWPKDDEDEFLEDIFGSSSPAVDSILIVIFSIVMVSLSCYMLWNVGRVYRFKEVQGVIVSSYVENDYSVYRPNIVYSYHVDGKYYENTDVQASTKECLNRQTCLDSRYAFSPTHLEFSQNLVDRYPPETTVTVYYNPANAEEAYLEKEGISFTIIIVTLGAMLTILWGFFEYFYCAILDE